MARIYLDTTYFIDIIEQRKSIKIEQFLSHTLFLSPLSIHIYVYLYKQKMPNKNLKKLLGYFNIVAIDEKITIEDLKLPTGVTVLTDSSQVVAKIAELVTKEAQEQAEKEAKEAEEAKAEEGAEAPEAAEQGEEKPETSPVEEKKEE